MAGVSNQMTTQRNPAFFNFVGGDGQVTVAEKRASDRGVAARGTSGVTTGRDRCKRGKACGATCIAGNEDCILDFPEPVQKQIRKMAKFLMERRGIKGADDAEQQQKFLQGTQIGKAALGVGKHLTEETTHAKPGGKGERIASAIFGTKDAWGVKQALHAREIIDLKNRRDQIGDAQDKPELLKMWQRDVQNRGVTLKKEDLEDLFDSLPKGAQRQLIGSGNPNRKQGDAKWYGIENGKEITNGKSGTRARGLAVLDMYIRQGGTDAYSSSTSRIFSPANLDVEHIKPVSKGGKDHPDNWVLARAGAQRLRADQHLGKWIDSLPDPNDRNALRDHVSLNARLTRARKATKELSKLTYNDRKNMTDEEWHNVTLQKRFKTETLPSGAKKQIPVVEAVKAYMFLSPTGDKDGFLGSSFLSNPDQTPGVARAFSSPQGWKQAYAMYHKDHSYDEAIALRSKIKDAWDGYSKRGEYGVGEATAKVKKLFQDGLTPNQLKIVGSKLDSANNELNKKYSNVGATSAGTNVSRVGGVNVSGLKPGQIGILRKMENAGMSSSDIREIVEGMKLGD